MKATIFTISAFFLLLAHEASARDNYIKGYTRKDGSYVEPHYRSSPDSTVTNNHSYEDNYNPYTGNAGDNHYKNDITSPYYESPDNNGKTGHQKNNQYNGLYR
jgi:hypothetical protein